jgi:hypothetical protein
MNTKSLLNESAGFNKKMSEESKGLVSKWEKTGLLEGIANDFERSTIATLLENQAKQLVSEASSTGTSANSEEWSGVALPLVRRIFSEIAAKEFVSVQPMNLPSGLVFYLDFKYGTAQPGFETGAGKNSQADSVFGITETAGNASEGLYGAGRFGYSMNDATTATLTNHASASVATGVASGLAVIGYDAAFSASAATANTNLGTVSVPVASLSGYDAEGVRAFDISGSGIVQYYPQTGAGFNANPETDLGIPELNVELRSVPIVAKTRKLKAQWTPEFAQDLNAYHSIDAEAELTSMLSEYISQEIDLEILDMLMENALTKVGYVGSNFADGTAARYTQQQWLCYLVRFQRFSILGNWCCLCSIYSINYDSSCIRP